MPKVTRVTSSSKRTRVRPKRDNTTSRSNTQPRASTNGVLAKVKKLEIDVDGIKMNIYGKSGTGKTTLWATFPKPILCILCSSGGELRSINTPKYRKVIDQIVLESSSELDEIAESLKEQCDYSTVVLDHLGGLQDLITREILGLDKALEQSSWGMATQAQYGQMALQLKSRLRTLLDIPRNVVIVAQEREYNVDGDNSNIIQPYIGSATMPSVLGWLGPACDYVCRTFIRQRTEEKEVEIAGEKITSEVTLDGVEYCLQIGQDGVCLTKFRRPKELGEMPTTIIDPDFDKLFDIMNVDGG